MCVHGAIFVLNNSILTEIESVSNIFYVIAFWLAQMMERLNLFKYIEAADLVPTANMTFQQTLIGMKPAPIVAGYATGGPSLSNPCILKPDVMAPGSQYLVWYIHGRTFKRCTSRMESCRY